MHQLPKTFFDVEHFRSVWLFDIWYGKTHGKFILHISSLRHVFVYLAILVITIWFLPLFNKRIIQNTISCIMCLWDWASIIEKKRQQLFKKRKPVTFLANIDSIIIELQVSTSTTMYGYWSSDFWISLWRLRRIFGIPTWLKIVWGISMNYMK